MLEPRKVDKTLILKIEEIASNQNDPYFWEKFYEFIILSYSKKSCNRFGVSDLFFKLKEYNLPQTKDMIKIYAHGLYILAKYNKKEIYGENFNV